MRKLIPVGAVLLASILSACGSHPRRAPGDQPAPFHPPIELLQRYDTNHDGTITREELEAGLKADFDAADTNHDGRLDADEVAAVNAQRWNDYKSTATTIVDWNQDGYVDFNEFAAAPRSLFEQLDRDGDGKLSPKEWRPFKPKTDADKKDEKDTPPSPDSH